MSSSIASVLNNHNDFFMRLIERVPHDLYSREDSESEHEEATGSSKYQKHRREPLTADKKKFLNQQVRTEKYRSFESAPTHPAPVLPVVLGEVEVERKYEQFKGEKTETFEADNRHALDVLRERLQSKILGMREKRGSGNKKTTQASSQINSQNAQTKTRHANNSSRSPVKEFGSALEINRKIRKDILEGDSVFSVVATDSKSKVIGASDIKIDDTGDVEFGEILMKNKKKSDLDGRSSDYGKPGAKVRRLKRMLQDAEKKRRRIEELKSQGEKGIKRAHAEQWNDVLNSAAGSNALHDTLKLKKALKRREKKRIKSAGEWQGRLEKLSLSQDAKREKREKNIRQRQADGVLVKSFEENGNLRVGIKSEKKKKPKGAGFDGKKLGFLNKSDG